MKRYLLFIILIICETAFSQVKLSDLNGPYFGQKVPAGEPLLFAPDIISLKNVMVHDTPKFSPDGNEIFWGEFSTNPNHTSIKFSRLINNKWTEPELVPFSSPESYGDGCPFMLPDGKVLYFSSFRSLKKGGKSGRERIWYVERQGDAWGEPTPVSEYVNKTDLHWQHSVSENRSLYFSTDQGIMRSQFVSGKHQKPEKITEVMNPEYVGGTPYISPDENYIIFSSDRLPGSLGKRDLYIGYRKNDGTWSDPIHLGNMINTPQHDLCPIVTYDGKYLLYLSMRADRQGIYWISADFIEKLKPQD